MTLPNTFLGLGFAVFLACLAMPQGEAQAASDGADLEWFAVHINQTPKQPWPLFGAISEMVSFSLRRTWPEMLWTPNLMFLSLDKTFRPLLLSKVPSKVLT